MVSRAPVLHTYALTSLNYWKWDHPQLWCEPLPRGERLHGGIAPATKTSSGRPCPSLWRPLPGRQTLPGRQALGGLVLQRFAGSSRAWREAYERIGVSGAGTEVWVSSERPELIFHLDLHDVTPSSFCSDLSVCSNSPGRKPISVWSADLIQHTWVTSKDW